MPTAPLRACAVSFCPVLVERGRCPAHGGARPPWHHATPVTRIRGRKLQALRATLFAREPLCRLCAAQGLTVAATIRDHIVPLAEGGRDDASNEQPLCQSCSDAKTQQESARGLRRAR